MTERRSNDEGFRQRPERRRGLDPAPTGDTVKDTGFIDVKIDTGHIECDPVIPTSVVTRVRVVSTRLTIVDGWWVQLECVPVNRPHHSDPVTDPLCALLNAPRLHSSTACRNSMSSGRS